MPTAKDLAHALSFWSPSDPASASWVLPELKTLLRAEFVGAYRPAATETGWSLDFMHGAGTEASGYVEVFRKYVGELPRSEAFLTLSNPHLVQRQQRNRVFLLSELIRLQHLGERAEPFDSLFTQLGISGHDQLRVLVCEGPRQLAWVGATRKEPFTRREALVLRQLVQPLRERFRLEWLLSGPLLALALDAALDALPTAAFVLGPQCRIESANRLGLLLLERDRPGLLEALRAGVGQSHVDTTATPGAFSITRLSSPGLPPYLLAIQREPNRTVACVMRAQREWCLSTRQARVLELMVTGASNKEIAASLSCAESTVETHVAELFRRSGARSRAGLVGSLLALG
jgi:DNA-binding CsgD family transcriptional regulator